MRLVCLTLLSAAIVLQIKIVFVQVASEFSAAFFIFSQDKASRQKNKRDDDRGDHVNSELALQSFNHTPSLDAKIENITSPITDFQSGLRD